MGKFYSSFALGTAKMTVSTPMAPTMGTMMRATEPLGIKTKVESSTIATMMPHAGFLCNGHSTSTAITADVSP